jgi:hypothetical protein
MADFNKDIITHSDILSTRGKWQDKVRIASDIQEANNAKFYSAYVQLRSPNEFVFGKFSDIEEGKILFTDDSKYGCSPDLICKHLRTNKVAFFDTKEQGKTGNAHERGYKWNPDLGFATRIKQVYKTGNFPAYLIYSGEMIKTQKYIEELHLAWHKYPGIYFLDTGISEDRIAFNSFYRAHSI